MLAVAGMTIGDCANWYLSTGAIVLVQMAVAVQGFFRDWGGRMPVVWLCVSGSAWSWRCVAIRADEVGGIPSMGGLEASLFRCEPVPHGVFAIAFRDEKLWEIVRPSGLPTHS